MTENKLENRTPLEVLGALFTPVELLAMSEGLIVRSNEVWDQGLAQPLPWDVNGKDSRRYELLEEASKLHARGKLVSEIADDLANRELKAEQVTRELKKVEHVGEHKIVS